MVFFSFFSFPPFSFFFLNIIFLQKHRQQLKMMRTTRKPKATKAQDGTETTHTEKLQQIHPLSECFCVCERERLCSVYSHGTLWSSFINLLLMLWAKLSAVVVWTAVGGELVGPGTFDPFCAGDAGDKEGPASRASPSCILKPSSRELHYLKSCMRLYKVFNSLMTFSICIVSEC